MIKTIMLKGPKVRTVIMAILLAVSCFLTYYFHAVLETSTVFTHFFYIPIILASLWWKRKGLLVAIFLAVVLISSHIFLRPDVLTANDYFRALMFIGVSLVTVMLSERIARTGTEELENVSKIWSFQVAKGGDELVSDVYLEPTTRLSASRPAEG